mmetsp:Transcript_9090/g.35561  ORF Transcript_9090/g.35561 Transcript_9090/m.35561 type:complete len:598 (+) Transcript_9090:163-1956(+)
MRRARDHAAGGSVAALVAEQGGDLGVVGVHGRDPVGPVRLKVLPDDVGKELVGGLAGVEAIDGLDGAAGVAVLLHVLGEERLPVDVQAVHLESVRVVVGGDDLVVDLGEVVGALLGEGAKGVVGGEPAVAGVGPNTGEGGVEVGVVHAQRVGLVVHGVVEDGALNQAHDRHLAAGGQGVVELLEGLENGCAELGRRGHAGETGVSVADVVADESVEREDGVVVDGVALEVGDEDLGGGAHAGAVDARVGEVAVHAEVAGAHALVDGAHLHRAGGALVRLAVAGRPGALGPVKLVGGGVDDVVEAEVHGVEVLGRDVEVRQRRVADADHAHGGVGARAEELLVRRPGLRVRAADAVAVVVDVGAKPGGDGAAAGVHRCARVVAVAAAPARAAQLGGEQRDVPRGEGVAVAIGQRQVVVEEGVDVAGEVPEVVAGKGHVGVTGEGVNRSSEGIAGHGAAHAEEHAGAGSFNLVAMRREPGNRALQERHGLGGARARRGGAEGLHLGEVLGACGEHVGRAVGLGRGVVALAVGGEVRRAHRPLCAPQLASAIAQLDLLAECVGRLVPRPGAGRGAVASELADEADKSAAARAGGAPAGLS